MENFELLLREEATLTEETIIVETTLTEKTMLLVEHTMLIQEQRTPVATPVATPVGNPVATPVLLDPLPILVTVDDPPPTVEPKAPTWKLEYVQICCVRCLRTRTIILHYHIWDHLEYGRVPSEGWEQQH